MIDIPHPAKVDSETNPGSHSYWALRITELISLKLLAADALPLTIELQNYSKALSKLDLELSIVIGGISEIFKRREWKLEFTEPHTLVIKPIT